MVPGHCRQKISSIHLRHTTKPCTWNAFKGHLVSSLKLLFLFLAQSSWPFVFAIGVHWKQWMSMYDFVRKVAEFCLVFTFVEVCAKLYLRNISVKTSKAINCTELEQVVHTHRTQEWLTKRACYLDPSPHSWIFPSILVILVHTAPKCGTEPIQYETFCSQDWTGAALLHCRNCTTVVMCEQKPYPVKFLCWHESYLVHLVWTQPKRHYSGFFSLIQWACLQWNPTLDLGWWSHNPYCNSLKFFLNGKAYSIMEL